MHNVEAYEKMAEALVQFNEVLDDYLEAEGHCSSSFLDSLADFRRDLSEVLTAKSDDED